MADIRKVSDLQPDKRNANKGTERGLKALDHSLRHYGAGRSLLVDKHGRIIAGNKTAAAAADIGLDDVILVQTDGTKLVAVQRTDLDLEQDKAARELAYADNRVGQLDLDFDVAVLLEDIGAGVNLDALWRPDELEALVSAASQDVAATGEDKGPQVDRAAELQAQWGTALGQVWELGEHRLAVGDCTDRATVEAVMRGETLRLFVTDPPYGVSYSDKNEYLNAVAKGNSIQTPIKNDHLNAVDMQAVWFAAFRTAFDVADGGCPYYIHAPQGGDHMMMMMMIDKAGWLVQHELMWLKNNHVLGRADYQYKHEPIIYGWKPGSHWFYGDRSQFSVWEFPKPNNSDLHPTMKPVELEEKAIQNSSRTGEAVGDWFAGSGTTLVACEKLRRKCRAIELDEGYAAVILQRWADLTGKTPRLLT